MQPKKNKVNNLGYNGQKLIRGKMLMVEIHEKLFIIEEITKS